MQFTVPKFIEHEAKIIGPLTFKQSFFIGIPGAICFMLYFTIGQKYFFPFIIIAMLLMGSGAALAFLKVSGQGLPTVIVNFFRFSLSPKIYIWKKAEAPMVVSTKREIQKKEEKEEPILQISGTSYLKKTKSRIETKTIS